MPSPFPGMDPYLEGNLWTSFHAFFVPQIAVQLNHCLRPKYVAWPERQYIRGALDEVMITPTKLVPDVSVRRTRAREIPGNGVVAVAPSVKLRTHIATKVPHYRIEIRDVSQRRLVTAIELLSPTNKGSGRKAYLRKRRRFLQSTAHLLEIDLHHQGRRIPLDDPYPDGAYFVLLNRARKRALTEVWAVGLDQALPVVSVPLLKGDADVTLDLQGAFTAVYDAGAFDLEVDYRRAPEIELPPAELAWIDDRLRGQGVRK